MRTLIQPINRWLIQGQKPRTFVRITDAADGSEILFPGTQAYGVYDDLIDKESGDRITRSIRHEGGMAEVSGARVNNLILDECIPFCTEVSLDPQFQSGIRGAGCIYSTSGFYSSNPPSVGMGRNAIVGMLITSSIVVGRNRTGTGPYSYIMYRGFLQFLLSPPSIPLTLTTCEDAYIQLSGILPPSGGGLVTPTFTIYGMGGTWTDLATGGPIFNDFVGWKDSGDYDLTENWIESWTTDEFGATVYLRLNAKGRAAIVAAAGSPGAKWFRIMLISNRDADFTNYGHAGTIETGPEYAPFTAETAKLILRYNSKTLDNQPSAIYFGIDPLPATHADMDLTWTGVMDSYEISDRNLNLTAKQNDHKKNPTIPARLLNLTDYPNCPEENIGKTIPIIYGDFLSAISHKEGIPYVANENDGAIIYSHKDFVKAYVYDRSYRNILISANNIKQIDNMFADYDNNLGMFLFYAGDITPHTGNKTFTIDANIANKFPYNISDNSIVPILGLIPTYFPLDMTVPQHLLQMIDEDETNYSTILPNEGSTPFYLNGYLKRIISGDIFVNHRYICFYTISDTGYDTGFIFAVDKYLNGSIHAEQHVTINSDGWHYINIEDEHITDGTLDYKFYLINFTGYLYGEWLVGEKTIKISNLSFCVGLKKDFDTCVYIACKGAYDDTIGTVTGTDSLLIENPSHVIESIARSEIGLLAAEIDTAAFDAAATALAGMKFAFQLNDRKPARELLNDLAFQARLKIWWDEQDRLTCKKFNAAAFFPVSGTDIPGALDMFTTTGEPAAGSFTTHQIIDGPILTRMELDEVKNDFILKYKQNYATNEYSEVLRVNKDEENLDETICAALGTTGAALQAFCTSSYAAVKTVNTLEIEAWAIRDETTATALMQHLIERLSVRRWKLEFTAGPSAVQFEEGDFINVRDDLIENRFGKAVMNIKKWEIIGYEPDPISHDVTIRAIEV